MRTFLALRCILRVAVGLAVTLCVSLFALVTSSCAADVLRLRVKFYIVYCTSAQSQTDIVAAVKGEGGAGFVISYGGENYTSAVCCFLSGEAKAAASSFTKRGLSSDVLAVSLYKFRLETYNASRNAALYENNLNTLYDISRELGDIAYLIEANSQSNARTALHSCVESLAALLNSNRSNCFTSKLAHLITLASDCAYSEVVLAREVRYVQMATVNVIINTKLT